MFLTAVVLALAVIPLVYVFDAQFYKETRVGLSEERSLDAVKAVYASAEYLGYLANALILAALVTALSLLVGVVLALLVARTDLSHKSLWDTMITLPLYLSPFTGLMAWITLGSEKTGFINHFLRKILGVFIANPKPLVNIWSYGGVVFIMFLFFCPFVYLFTVGSLRSMNTSLEEAARMSGATAITGLRKITLPMCLPAILASGLLVFVLSVEMYTVPGIIGATVGFTTLPWKIFEDSTAIPVHRAHAAAGGCLLLFVTIAGVWLQNRLTHVSSRFVTVGGKGFQGRPIALGKYSWLAVGIIFLYVLLADILPFGALLIASFMRFSASMITPELFTTKHYVAFFTTQNMMAALWNTIFLAVLTGIICVLLGFVISLMDLRRPSPVTKSIAFLSILPVAVPGLVYGLGLLWTYLQTPLYGTIWILLLAHVAKMLPYGVIVSRSGLLQLHPELEESARMCGATPTRAIASITAPLIKPTLIAILFFVMLNSIKELSASILLYSSNSHILSVLTWHYMDNGDYQYAAAIGIIQTAIMIGIVLITRMLFRARLEAAFGQ